MISIVTTTVSLVASTQILASLGLEAVLTLLFCLVMKELVTSTRNIKLTFLGHHLDVVILPIYFVFVFIVMMKVIEILI